MSLLGPSAVSVSSLALASMCLLKAGSVVTGETGEEGGRPVPTHRDSFSSRGSSSPAPGLGEAQAKALGSGGCTQGLLGCSEGSKPCLIS